MENGGSQSGDENSGVGDRRFGVFFLEEKERQSDEETEQQSGDEGMRVSAIESEIGGGTEISAEQVEVGDGSSGEDGEGDGASDAREGGALQGIGGESVSEGIHERSYLTKAKDCVWRKRAMT
jgi:hypothetical protein